MTPALTTERLVLRHPEERDREPFGLLCADAEVMRHIGLGRPLDRTTAERSFTLILVHWQRHGYGLRTAEAREDGAYLGFVGLNVVPAGSDAAGEMEIGWRLRREAWGKGLATEGAEAVRAEAFDHLRLESLVALVQPDNAASRRVSEKLGMHMEREGRGVRGEPVLVYRLARASRPVT